MENQVNDLLQFISLRFPNIRFEVIHNSFSPTLKHFVIKDENNDKGFGSDHNYFVAIEKAYSEFIERKTFKQLNKMFGQFETSNGFSAHKTIKKAKESSIFELIERDALLTTWHNKIAPYWLTEKEFQLTMSPENLEIYLKHKNIGLKLNLGIVAKHDGILTCIVKVKGKYNGKDFFYIDTKTGSNLINISNALVEGISFYSHYISFKNIQNYVKKKSIHPQPMDHFYYYLKNLTNVDWFHKGSSNVVEIPTHNINTYVLKSEEIINKENLKRFVSFSESEMMQSYYCGEFDLKNINLERFHHLFGKKINFNKQMHPLS